MNVGDTVYKVAHNGDVTCRLKIIAVKQLQRGLKVTTNNGIAWDIEAQRTWGSRSERWYRGAYIEAATSKLEQKYMYYMRAANIRWLARNLHEFTGDQLADAGDAAIELFKQWKASS